jgi:hypothetical protein
MKNNEPFRLEIRIDRASAHRALVVGGILILLAVGGAVLATPVPVQGTYASGQVLKKADLDTNFNAIEARLTAVEAITKLQSKVRICGVSSLYNSGALASPSDKSGYQTKAFAACHNALTTLDGGAPVGCGAQAHICTSGEVLASIAAGATSSTVPALGYGATWVFDATQDCKGWTSSAASDYATAYDAGNLKFTKLPCDGANHFYCCE